jgi:hypothetical protein
MSSYSFFLIQDIDRAKKELNVIKVEQFDKAKRALQKHYDSFVVERRKIRNQPVDGSPVELLSSYSLNPYETCYNKESSSLTKYKFECWIKSKDSIAYMEAVNKLVSVSIVISYLDSCRHACSSLNSKSQKLIDEILDKDPTCYPFLSDARPKQIIEQLYPLMDQAIEADKKATAESKSQYDTDKFWANTYRGAQYVLMPLTSVSIIFLVINPVMLPITIPLIMLLLLAVIVSTVKAVTLENKTIHAPSDDGELSCLSRYQTPTNVLHDYTDEEKKVISQVYSMYDIPRRGEFFLLAEPEYFSSVNQAKTEFTKKSIMDFVLRAFDETVGPVDNSRHHLRAVAF